MEKKDYLKDKYVTKKRRGKENDTGTESKKRRENNNKENSHRNAANMGIEGKAINSIKNHLYGVLYRPRVMTRI